MTQLINDKDLNFLLYDVFKLEQLTELERYQEHDKTTFDSILDTAKGIATDYFAPHNAKADQHEPTFDGKKSKPLLKLKLHGTSLPMPDYSALNMIMMPAVCSYQFWSIWRVMPFLCLPIHQRWLILS